MSQVGIALVCVASEDQIIGLSDKNTSAVAAIRVISSVAELSVAVVVAAGSEDQIIGLGDVNLATMISQGGISSVAQLGRCFNPAASDEA